MTKPGDSFVAEDFLRPTRGDVVLWTTASLLVIAGLVGGYWAYQTYVPVEQAAGPPPGAMVVEFAEFAVSPETEELDVPEGELSAASEATPPSEAEPDPEAEPIEEPEPVVEPEVEPEEAVEPEEVAEPEKAVEPKDVVEMAETEVEPPSEPEVDPTPEPFPEPEPAVVPEPVEPIIEVPEVEVPEPAVVIQRQMATVERPEPEPEPVVEPEEIIEPPEPEPEPEPIAEPESVPEEPVVEPVDPNLPVPVTMSPRIAETRENTPATKFTPPPRRTPPPQQAATQASAPKPQEQQAQQAAAPQQTDSAKPSASQVDSWQRSLQRHLARRQRNPNDRLRNGRGGTVLVQFSLDAEGNVLSVNIVGSSGVEILDQAARDLVLRSSPLPAPPVGWRGVVAIPLQYDPSP